MDRWATMTVFRRVAELRSFTSAARELGLSTAAVSKHVAHLEERLRTRLLHRTTRKVTPTAAGEAYLARCASLLDELADLDLAASQGSQALRGQLRVNAPAAFGLAHLSREMPVLLAVHPELAIELSLTDRFVDLVEEGVDVVIRIATELPDSSSLVAQRLVGSEHVIVAAPAYLARRGTPRRTADLPRHDCLVYGMRRAGWEVLVRGAPTMIPVTSRYSVDNSLALREAVLAGVGLAMTPRFYVDDDLRAKRLVQVLPATRSRPAWVHAVYPRQRHLSPRVRVFVDHLRRVLAPASWALRP